VLIHGLARRSSHLHSLGRFFSRAGYTVYVYDYYTTKNNIANHGRDFGRFLKEIATRHHEMKINIISHSLGGIITREALTRLNETDKAEILKANRIKSIVMLAPPNHGSAAAGLAMRIFPFAGALMKPLAELSSKPDAYVHNVPVPTGIPIGIIASRLDLHVSVSRTILKEQTEHMIVSSGHDGIVNRRNVRDAALRFIETGKF
jgi:pimeloyl-ACP methyl ester carboxylesterase